MNRRYTFKLYPHADQAEELRRQCGLVGELWNALLHIQEDRYRRTKGQRGVIHGEGKSHLSEFDMSYMISTLRAECPEWQHLSTWTPRRVCKALDQAFAAFFRRAKQGAGAQSGYPKYKSAKRGQHNWLPHRCASGCELSHVDGNSWSLRLKGVDGPIHARGKMPAMPDKWTDADIREMDGVWWLSIAAQMPERGRASGCEPVEVRLGQIDCFARMNGRMILAGSLGLIRAGEDRRIERLQQVMAALPKGSEQWHAARRRKARIQNRQRRRRREKLHEWTTTLVESASEIVLITPQSIREETRSGRGDEREWGGAVETKALLNRHVLNGAPAMAAEMIRYKAQEAGVPIREATHDDLSEGNLVVEGVKANRKLARSVKRERASEKRNRIVGAGEEHDLRDQGHAGRDRRAPGDGIRGKRRPGKQPGDPRRPHA